MWTGVVPGMCLPFVRDLAVSQGTPDQLAQSIADTRRQTLETMAEAVEILEDYETDPVPFPERAHLNVLFIAYLAGFYGHIVDWCDEAEAEIATWPDTTVGVGLTPGTRRMLADALALYRSRLGAGGDSEGAP